MKIDLLKTQVVASGDAIPKKLAAFDRRWEELNKQFQQKEERFDKLKADRVKSLKSEVEMLRKKLEEKEEE